MSVETEAALRRAQEVSEELYQESQRRERLAHQLLDAAGAPSAAGLRENAKSPRFQGLLAKLLEECAPNTDPHDLEQGLILRLVGLVMIERLRR